MQKQVEMTFVHVIVVIISHCFCRYGRRPAKNLVYSGQEFLNNCEIMLLLIKLNLKNFMKTKSVRDFQCTNESVCKHLVCLKLDHGISSSGLKDTFRYFKSFGFLNLHSELNHHLISFVCKHQEFIFECYNMRWHLITGAYLF